MKKITFKVLFIVFALLSAVNANDSIHKSYLLFGYSHNEFIERSQNNIEFGFYKSIFNKWEKWGMDGKTSYSFILGNIDNSKNPYIDKSGSIHYEKTKTGNYQENALNIGLYPYFKYNDFKFLVCFDFSTGFECLASNYRIKYLNTQKPDTTWQAKNEYGFFFAYFSSCQIQYSINRFSLFIKGFPFNFIGIGILFQIRKAGQLT